MRRARSSGRSNVVYQWNFVRNLKAPDAAQARLLPGRASISRASTRSAPSASSTKPTPRRYFGFDGAEDYYHRASAMRVVDRIRVPALIITAEDDPFVPVAAVPRSEADRQPAHHAGRHPARRPLRVRRRTRGGDDDGYWAEQQIVDFACGSWRQPQTLCPLDTKRALRRFANSGPFPSSSCLKYTNASRRGRVAR